jgi:exonuclease SbcD
MRKPIGIGLADTHAHDNNLKLQVSIWKQAVELAKKLDVDKLFHLGDWVVERKAQSLGVLEHLEEMKEYVKYHNLELIGISGNHDKTNQESIFAYPNLYGGSGFHIVEDFHEEIISEDLSVWFLPYFPEMGTYPDKVEMIKKMMNKDKRNILITHIGVNGGLAHESATINKEVSAGLFEGFYSVQIGHFHNRNLVEHDGTAIIWYVGSTHAANYGEDNEKGFTIFYDDGSIEFHNAEFPKFETIKVDVEEVDGKWLSETKKYIKETGINVRVIVTGDESELKKIKKQKFSDIGVKKLKLNAESVAIRGEDNKVVFVSLDKKAVKKLYKKFSVNNEIDPSFGLEYLDM